MKKALIFISLFLLFAISASAQTLTIHYHRYEGDYDGWGMHLWGAIEESGGTFYINGVPYSWTNPLPHQGSDDFGVFWEIPIEYPENDLGFIVHRGEEKDPGSDRFITDFATTEVWLLQGVMEIFTENPGTGVMILSATGNGINEIDVLMSRQASNIQENFEVKKEGETESVASIISTDGINVAITLENDIDITKAYEVSYTREDNSIVSLAVHHQFPIDEYVYNGDDLGFTYTPSATTFKLWSPTASGVNIFIYDNYDDEDPSQIVPMERVGTEGEVGVLSCTIDGDLSNKYYLYEMSMAGEIYTAQDPYSVAVSTNTEKSMIINLDDTDPEGWENDTYPVVENQEDIIIWEVHIRDLTIADTWNGTEANRGKYLGMVESGTSYNGMPTGFDHIVDLGVTAVQIMPMYDFGSVNETITDNEYNRNWGYDPMAYNVPEGSYSSDPTGAARITELKQMVKGFHDAGIQVIMDVVYNHTYGTGMNSLFDKVVPKYYYSLNPDGSYCNYSGCGNATDSGKPMVSNFIKQSVKYWMEEYHIDGFRFDLMGIHETDMMIDITEMAREINPSAQIHGEPWSGWGAPILTGIGSQKGQDFSVFNDRIRNAVRGSTDGTDPGYALGSTSSTWNTVKTSVAGSIDDNDFEDPDETLNYISAHDNYTWFDKIERSTTVTEAEQASMNKLGQAIVLTSQGIPFIHAGAEFQRTKRVPGVTDNNEEWVRNSYNAPDVINKLDWERKHDRIDIYNYYKGLIELRKARPEFRLNNPNHIHQYVNFWSDNPNGTMTFKITDVTPEDNWGDILVSYNPTGETQNISLPAGMWTVVVNEDYAGTADLETIDSGAYDGSFSVAPYSAKVMYETSTLNYALNIFQNPVLNNHLHFAVNVTTDAPEEISLAVDDADLTLDDIADNSWYASYEMASSGNHEVTLTVDGYDIIRTFAVGMIVDETSGRGGFGISSDGNLTIEFAPKSYSHDVYFAILDSKIKESLGIGVYEVGTNNIVLSKPATISFISDTDQAIYRKDGDIWTELATTYEDGKVVAETQQLGQFKLGNKTSAPKATKLLGNYPNPFNPTTTITYELATNGNASVKIYDTAGRLIKTLVDNHREAGYYTVNWDGKDNSDQSVPSGIYLYRLETEGQNQTKTMLLLK